MSIPKSLDQLNIQSYVTATTAPTQKGLVGLNPDGTSIAGGGAASLTYIMTSLDSLEIGSYVESVDVPGQVGVVLLNPNGSLIG